MTSLFFINKKSILLLSFLSFYSFFLFPPLCGHNNNTVQMQNILHENPSTMLITEIFEMIARINQSIQYIAIQIKQNNIKKIGNHLKANKLLFDLQNGITFAMLSDQTLLKVHPIQQAEIVLSYAHILNDLIDHIEWLLHKKFIFKTEQDKNRVQFNIVKSMQNATNATLEELPSILKKLREKVAAFEKNAHEISLSHLNKFTRILNKSIINPWKQWNMTEITKYSLAGSAAGLFALWKITGTYRFIEMTNRYTIEAEKNSRTPHCINEKGTYGERYVYKKNHLHIWDKISKKYSSNQNFIEKTGLYLCETLGLGYPAGCFQNNAMGIKFSGLEANSSVFSTLDLTLSQMLSNQWPIVTLLGGYFIAKSSEKWSGSVYPLIASHVEVIWNKMLGGAHRNIEVQNVFNVIPDVTLDDVIGMRDAKELFEHIIKFVMNPEPFYNTQSVPPTQLILSGPTRTGKTFMVEAFAGSLAEAHVKANRSPDTFQYWPLPGMAVKNYGIQHILEEAKKHAPVILFIDEIDLLNLQRGANTDLLGDFLTGMGNNLSQDPSKPVILIVATNRPETLDHALLQPGRFGKEIRFEYPPFRHRKSFLIREFEKMALDPKAFDIDSLAAKTDTLSYEQLRAIIRGGMIRAWSRKTPLTQMILEESLDTEIRCIITANRKELPEHEKLILASHFAGQGLGYVLFDTGKNIDKITLKAIQTKLEAKHVWEKFSHEEAKKETKKIIFGQIFTSSMGDSANFADRKQVVNKIKVLISGFIAEQIIVGSCGMTCHPEFEQQALELAGSLFMGFVDKSLLSKRSRDEMSDKAFSLLEECKKEVAETFVCNKELLERITIALKEKEGLTGREIQDLYNQYQKEQSDFNNNTKKDAIATA